MNLIIDVGNTLVKLGVFDPGKLIYRKSIEKESLVNTLSEVSSMHPHILKTIVSSVGRLSDKQITYIKQLYPTITLDHTTKVPFTNKYATPSTLGVDRIALISASAVQFPSKNVLVIDAGTAITYDFLSSNNEYFGGAISPGISLRYKSLHNYTAKLPLLETEIPKDFIGNTTKNSLHSGVVNGVIHEIDGFIDAYKNKFTDLTVILTGGDAHFLRDSIKNDIFANQNFLLEGLNHILDYNTY